MAEKEVAVRPSGLSVLSREQLVEYEGKCLGIVNGKVKFVGEDANAIVKALLAEKSPDKVFTSIPRGDIALVKQKCFQASNINGFRGRINTANLNTPEPFY